MQSESITQRVTGVLRRSAVPSPYPTYIPGGPCTAAPGPALLDIGIALEGDVKNTCLAPAGPIALFGTTSSGVCALEDSLLAQQITRQGAYVLMNCCIDYGRQDMLAHLHDKTGRLSDFYVINPDDPVHSHTYNPLASGSARQAATRVVNAMMMPRGDEEYLTEGDHAASVSILTPLIEALRERDGAATFARLNEALTDSDVFANLVQEPELAALVKSTLARLLRVLPNFTSGNFGQVVNVNAPDVDLQSILSLRKGLFLMLPFVGKDMTPLVMGRLLMEDLADSLTSLALSSTEVARPPALVLADEIALFATGRLGEVFSEAERGGATVVVAGGIAGLGSMPAADRKAILDNRTPKVFFKSYASEMPELMCQMGNRLAWGGASADLPIVLEHMHTALPGNGVIVRGATLMSFAVWPHIEVSGGIGHFELQHGANAGDNEGSVPGPRMERS